MQTFRAWGIRVGLALLVCAIVLGACSTPYQEMGILGGVTAQQVTTDTYRIVSRGNGYTSRTAIKDYTLLKAAETTRQAGGTHFVVIGAEDATRVGYTSGMAQTHVVGNMAMTTYMPPESYIKPGQDTYIRVITVAVGRAPPPGAFSADEIIRFIGPRVPREKA